MIIGTFSLREFGTKTMSEVVVMKQRSVTHPSITTNPLLFAGKKDVNMGSNMPL